ncbi:MAG: hypothetical protein JWR10_4308 [Rubritepida sp.]|nr:hypothetical protein [Rubritepida sp.]
MIRSLALLVLLASPALAQPRLTSFGAEGGNFRAGLSDGRVLMGGELIGAELNLSRDGAPFTVRIDSAEADTGGRAPDVWLFHLTMAGPDGTRQDYCSPDPQGRSLAIPYPAADEPSGFGITCSAGAIGKCLRFGYRPWAMAPDGVTSLAPYHATCVNLVRAAYGGPQHGYTRNGMSIDLYDRIGIQRADMAQGQAFEAGWTPAGAVCIAHPRVPENGSLAEITAQTPRLGGLTGPESCNEERAAALGALIFNRSYPAQ